MKYAEFSIDSHKIEFLNSLLGNEIVLVNGTEVSNRYSFFGTKHRFNLDADHFALSSSFKALGKRELTLKLERNQEIVRDITIDLNPKYKVYWGALAIIFGIIFYNFLENYLIIQ